ncbi:MAG: hypothetical protein QOE70_3969 [Chthoniobacter sp.]|jgi:WD40 repeat protein/Flp pilus assembly protein TadD|nr:hypothetical protein [Chthoniobacter sp.]
MRRNPKRKPEKLAVFICYRRLDGADEAALVYEQIAGKTLELNDGRTVTIDPYFDVRAPAIDDFRVRHLAHLSVSRAALLICTPDGAERRSPPVSRWRRRLGALWWRLTGSLRYVAASRDWLHEEIDWWMENRRTGPMLIDATGEQERFIPRRVRERWPRVQRLLCRVKPWPALGANLPPAIDPRLGERLLEGIKDSLTKIEYEDLQRVRRLLISVVTALAAVAVALVLAVHWAQRVGKANEEVRRSLVQTHFAQGARDLAEEKLPTAVAHLNRALEIDPGHPAALTALVSVLTQRSHPLLRLPPITGPAKIEMARLSPAGDQLLTIDAAGSAQLWDSSSGAPVGKPLRPGHKAHCGAFSVDGKRVALGFRGEVTLSGLAGEELRALQIGNPDEAVSFVAVAPDGGRVLAVTYRGAVAICAVAGDPVMAIPEGEWRLAQFSSDGRRVLTVGPGGAQVWNAADGQPVSPLLGAGRVPDLAVFSPDGRQLAVAEGDGTIQLWDTEKWKPSPPLRHLSPIGAMTFSPDGRRIVAGYANGMVKIWDIAAASEVQLESPIRHAGDLRHLAYSRDGQLLLTASADGSARVWLAERGLPFTEPLRCGSALTSAALYPDLRSAVTHSEDGKLRIWDIRMGKALPQPLDARALATARFLDDQRVLAFERSGERGNLRGVILDAKTGRRLAENVGPGGEVRGVTWSGAHFMAFTEDACVRLWSLTGEPIGTPIVGQFDDAFFSPDGQRIATVAGDTVCQWDARSGLSLGRPLMHERLLKGAFYSADGNRLVTWGQDVAWQWNANTSLLISLMQHDDRIELAEWMGMGGRLLTVTAAGSARLWNPAAAPIELEDGARAASLGPDHRRIAISLGGRTVLLCAADDLQPVGVAIPHRRREPPPFSSDGRRLLAAKDDEELTLIDTADGRVVKSLPDVLGGEFSPDARWLLTIGTASAALRDAETGEIVAALPDTTGPHEGNIFAPDGSTFILRHDNAAQLFRFEGGKATRAASLEHGARVDTILYSPDGQFIATRDREGVVRVWGTVDGRLIGGPISGAAQDLPPRFDSASSILAIPMTHSVQLLDLRKAPGAIVSLTESNAAPWRTEKLEAVAFAAAGQRLLTRSRGVSLTVHEKETGRQIGGPLARGDRIDAAGLSADARTVVTLASGKVRAWDLSGGPQPAARLLAADRHVRATALSPLGDMIAVATDGGVQLWDATLQRRLRELPSAGAKDIDELRFSPRGSYLVAAIRYPKPLLVRWDLSAAAVRPSAPLLEGLGVNAFEFSDDGRLLVAALHGDARQARVWNLASADPVGLPLGVAEQAESARFDAGSARVLVQTAEGVQWFDVVTSLPLGGVFPIRGRWGNLALSPDGRNILAFGNPAMSPDGRGISAFRDPAIHEVGPPSGARASAQLRRLAGIAAGGEIDPAGAFGAISADEIRAASLAQPGGLAKDFADEMCRWFLGDRRQRGVGPGSVLTVEKFIAEHADAAEKDRVWDCAMVEPWHPRVLALSCATARNPFVAMLQRYNIAQSGEYGPARLDFVAGCALAAAPEDGRVLAWVAEFKRANGLLQEARALADRAIASGVQDASALALRGALRVSSGDRSGGIADLRAARERSPFDPEILCQLGFQLVAAGQRRAAVEPTLQAIQIRPPGNEVLPKCAMTFCLSGELPMALEIWRQLASRGAPSHFLLVSQAVGFWEIGDTERARKLFAAGERQRQIQDESALVNLLVGAAPKYRAALEALRKAVPAR